MSGFDELYLPDARDRATFGDTYSPPNVFAHNEWHQVATIKATDDGQSVAIDECRMPARFFRLRLLPGQDSGGEQLPTNIHIGTGSGDTMGQLIFELGKAIAEGMAGIDVVPEGTAFEVTG